VDAVLHSLPALVTLERHFSTPSACADYGKASLEALQIRGCEVAPGPEINADLLTSLPDQLRKAQGVFETTGGLHAAALFDARGTLLALREDVAGTTPWTSWWAGRSSRDASPSRITW